MCAIFTPVKTPARLKSHFKVGDPHQAYADEVYPGQAAPFIKRSSPDAEQPLELATGLFGLVPHWAKDLDISRRTYNARSETVAEKPSFRDAWRRGQRCIVPVESIFEPSWETGKSIRWRIQRNDDRPMGLAGLWSSWTGPDGRELHSFTMLTINADGHGVMQRFHKPEDEKRMIVILDESDYDQWLDAPVPKMRDFLRRYPAEAMTTAAAPLPGKAPRIPPQAQSLGFDF